MFRLTEPSSGQNHSTGTFSECNIKKLKILRHVSAHSHYQAKTIVLVHSVSAILKN